MVMTMKLKHVDELSGGRKRFRRRFPKVVAEVVGEEFFQVPMKAREGAALVSEQETLLAEFEKIVKKAKRKAISGNEASTQIHLWSPYQSFPCPLAARLAVERTFARA